MQNQNTRRGFTLIELLVVVLIIAILAAVALPQYQKAVEKSRATQALTLLKALEQATASYFLANGQYLSKFEQLDVDVSAWTGTTKIHPGNNIRDTKSNENWSLRLWSDDPGKTIMIMLLRTKGQYKSAGFAFSSYYGITCAEDKTAGFPDAQKGAYCEKMFHATVIDPKNNTFRRYQLP